MFNQSQWSGTDAALAMKQAIALTMGEPIANINIGYASQLCLTSPTMSPSISPTFSPSKEPTSGLRMLQSDIDVTSALSEADGSHGIMLAAVPKVPLSFSIYKKLPGNSQNLFACFTHNLDKLLEEYRKMFYITNNHSQIYNQGI